MVDKRFLDDVKDRILLSDVVRKYVPLENAGREYKACCPFHKENTPSFYVNDQKQFYHCFGCGAHGDIYGFMMKYNNLPFMEAVEQLASEIGLSVPKPSPEQKQKYDRKEKLLELIELACQWFQEQLYKPENTFVIQYLKRRGITKPSVELFRLGYAPNDWDAFREFIIQKNFDPQDAIDVGLLKPSNKAGKEPYSFFRGRLIFPVTDLRGRVIAFGGRHMDEAYARPPQDKPPKYLNSPDHDFFSKGKLLYNMSRAMKAHRVNEPIVMVEGYTDVIALHQHGYAGAVAPLGTAVTEHQIQLIWNRLMEQGSQTPILCFDGDNAGRGAAFRALDRALPHFRPGCSLRFAFVPDGQDPDSILIDKGRSAMDAVLSSAESAVNMVWLKHANEQKFDTPETQAGLKAGISQSANRIQDNDVRQLYYSELMSKFYDAVKKQRSSQYGKQNKPYRKSNTGPQKPSMKVTPVTRSKDETRKQIILATLVNHPTLLDEFSDMLNRLEFQDVSMAELRDALIAYAYDTETNGKNAENVREHLINEGFESILSNLLGQHIYTHAHFAKPDADVNKALKGIENVIDLINRDNIKNDVMNYKNTLSQNFTNENYERLSSLKKHLNADDSE